ncbi:hypothetical protein BB561_000690 [Smittium simulii]|uniref:Uncharacterized protein n=1 Tax=Smittium simulii TaxID=133385 RepID=A0A2T9YXW5_9FUNG|nr:hypothetical protein BB561_000690 [Smittium simulii]
MQQFIEGPYEYNYEKQSIEVLESFSTSQKTLFGLDFANRKNKNSFCKSESVYENGCLCDFNKRSKICDCHITQIYPDYICQGDNFVKPTRESEKKFGANTVRNIMGELLICTIEYNIHAEKTETDKSSIKVSYSTNLEKEISISVALNSLLKDTKIAIKKPVIETNTNQPTILLKGWKKFSDTDFDSPFWLNSLEKNLENVNIHIFKKEQSGNEQLADQELSAAKNKELSKSSENITSTFNREFVFDLFESGFKICLLK